MAQYSTPSADITDGAWLNQAASATDIYLSIVPDTPGSIGAGDDTDYAESEANPSASAFAVDMSTIEDPVSQTGHVRRWRRQLPVTRSWCPTGHTTSRQPSPSLTVSPS